MSYYYLISSLPMLNPQGELPFPYEKFLEMCKSSVGEAKYKALKELTLSSSEGAFLSKWSAFYSLIREELTYQRNLRLGKKSALPSYRDETVVKLVTSAINNENPLLAEELLLAKEFEVLDELVGTHYFDDSALLGYALKLKLLERKSSFKQKEGKAELNRIVAGLEDQIISMEQE